MKRILLVNKGGRSEVVAIDVKDGVQPTVVYALDDSGRIRMFRYDYTVTKSGGRTYPRFSEAESVPVLSRSLPKEF